MLPCIPRPASYTFTDEKGCEGDPKGKLYAVEKHGYTDPVTIPWPQNNQLILKSEQVTVIEK